MLSKLHESCNYKKSSLILSKTGNWLRHSLILAFMTDRLKRVTDVGGSWARRLKLSNSIRLSADLSHHRKLTSFTCCELVHMTKEQTEKPFALTPSVFLCDNQYLYILWVTSRQLSGTTMSCLMKSGLDSRGSLNSRAPVLTYHLSQVISEGTWHVLFYVFSR